MHSKMEGLQINLLLVFLFPALISVFLLWTISKRRSKPKRTNNPPPSPPKLPVVGSLHLLSLLPHRSFLDLSKKHGPLMLLHFGRVPVLVVSSSDTACLIMKTHDVSFSDRPRFEVQKKILYDARGIVFAPYGEQWRQVKSNCVLQLLSNKRVRSFHTMREEETALFVKKISESSGCSVNLSQMFFQFTYNGICRSSFGKKPSDSEVGMRFVQLLSEVAKLLETICIGDFIPWLSWIDHVSGLHKRIDKVTKGLDEMLESIINERLESQMGITEKKTGEDFLDILLENYKDNRETVKAIILDIFGGATDTSAAMLEWTMTELLRHPSVMEKLQREVREIVGKKNDITDNDIEKMHYMRAVIKESLRCHPPLPLLIPRAACRDVKIDGYDVAAGTVVMVNVWAIGRDPKLWDEPEKFKPERFLNSTIDFKGVDFELLPFGGGRRGCPGIAFAMASIELLLANLMAKFDWELAGGVQGQDLDMNETHGVTMHKVVPLHAIATIIA